MPNLYAYVDETGDPGGSGKSSEAFGMSAVILGPSGAVQARELVDELRLQFKIPNNKVLSWKDHVRQHERRKYVAKRLSQLTDITVTFAYCRKTEVSYGQFTKSRGMFYNFVAGKLYKNILWATKYWPSGTSRVTTRFGHVKGFDHSETQGYFTQVIDSNPRVPHELENNLSWVAADKYRESVIADLFSGCLHQALTHDEYGNTEGSYLRQVWPLIRNSNSCAIPLGIISIPENTLVTRHDWFPCRTCKHKEGARRTLDLSGRIH
jgi:hypothetical protein